MTVNVGIRNLIGHAALTVSGHLRPGPDPACESALRAAFADLDAELAEILGDRARPQLLH
jgi:hypothetical protein